MNETFQTIFILLILLLLSAFFSATETAFSSLSKARLKTMADDGRRLAATALKLSERYDELLSTILIGNNIVNLSASAVATVWFTMHCQNHGALLSTVIVTVCILIFGEFTPKGLAKETPEEVAIFATPFMKFFMFICKPVNGLFLIWKKWLSRKMEKPDSPQVTDDELLHIVEAAAQEGGITQDAGELLKSAIEFRDVEASDICTPRVKMTAVSIDSTRDEINQAFQETGYSRLPVYRESPDDIVGLIHLKDFHFDATTRGFKIEKILKPTIYVAASQHIHDILHQMQRQKIQLAIVVDEYGGTTGMLTMEDILEEIVGEIYDEQDEVPEEIRDLGNSIFNVSCQMELENFAERFHLDIESDAQTIGGWLPELFEHIPAAGETIEYKNLTLRVLKADRTKVLEIQVTVHDTVPEE